MNPNPPKKQLKLSAPFDPTIAPKVSLDYLPQTTNIPVLSQPPQQIPQQTNVAPKPKKKLVLSQSVNFQPSDDVKKKLEETNKQKQLDEEKIKKEQELQEQQRLIELRKAKPYEKQQLVTLVACVSEYFVENSQKDDPNNESNKLLKDYGFLLQTLETMIPFFQKDEWQKLKERKHFNIKEIAIKNQPRKDGKANTYSKTQQSTGGSNQRPSHKPNAPQPFEKGTNFQQPSEQKEQPKLLIVRVQEDIATKQKKDEMKAQAEEFFQVLNRTPEQKEKINKELKYRLNQLAPDNYDSISQKIVELLVENTVDGETCYLQFIAERIIEKAQTEPKYRKLYTKLCSMLVKDSRLEGTKPGKNGKEGKKISLFKNELLGQVSSVFYNNKGKQEDITHLKPEEKEQYHLIRKAKIMGTARFIGELFLMKLLPVLAVEYAFQELIGGFILNYTPNQENSEEPIEGMIELLDQIGSHYEKQLDKKFDQTQIFNFFNGQSKTKAEIEAFFKIFEKVVSMDLVMTILDALVKSYKLSQRIQMLIENVQERKKQGWKDHYSRQESAQTSKSIQIEQEKEQIEQNYTQSKNKKRQNQEVYYVEKTSSQQSSQVKQQQFDLNELAMFVQGTFTMEPELQDQKLTAELIRVEQCDEALLKFYETFFQQMFNMKLIKKNIDRSQIVFELLSKEASKEEIVRKAAQKVLTEDKIYDLAESPVARDLFVDIIGPFLYETDLKNLRKLYLKPVDDIEDFAIFMTDIATILIQKFSEKENLIRDYYEILGFSF